MKTKFVQKNMKTEISGQKKFTCGSWQNSQKISPGEQISQHFSRTKYEIYNKNLVTPKFNLD